MKLVLIGECSVDAIVPLTSHGLSTQTWLILTDRLCVIYIVILHRLAGILGSISHECQTVGFDSGAVYVVL